MTPAFFGPASYTAKVLGPLAPPSAHLSWTSKPFGPVGNLLIFDGVGRLWPAAVSGATDLPAPRNGGCWRIGVLPGRIPLQRVRGLPELQIQATTPPSPCVHVVQVVENHARLIQAELIA